MTVYNPWGRSGGGAPIKDQKGNLFSELTFTSLRGHLNRSRSFMMDDDTQRTC